MTEAPSIDREARRLLDGLGSCCSLLDKLQVLLDRMLGEPRLSADLRDQIDTTTAAVAARLADAAAALARDSVAGSGDCTLRGRSPAIPIPSVLELLSSHSRTGTLRIGTGSETITLGVTRGEVTHAVSDAPPPNQRIGALLVARGALEQEALGAFLAGPRPRAPSLGEALVEAGLVGREQLITALEEQTQDLFRRLFTASRTTFSFHEGAPEHPNTHVAMSVMRLMLESMRRIDEAERDA